MIPSRLQHGRYELLGRLGRGGTAEVHRVLDTKTGHELAAKLVEGDHQARAVREGAILDALDHPNIVRVHARFDEGRWRVLLMELCAGSLADEVVEHGALDEPRLIEMGLAALSALSLAHARGVVHRDIKPQNLLLDQQGMLKVADFGVAAWRDATTELTRTGAVIGSVPFMAPEQRRGEPAGPAADLYALAATLAWCATGEVVGDLYTESVAARLRQTTRPTFADVLLRAGAHAPEDRFPSAQAMAEALRRVESETPRSSAAGTRGLPVRALLPVGGLLGVLVLTGIMSMGWGPTPPSLLEVPLCASGPVEWSGRKYLGPRESSGAAVGDLDGDGSGDAFFLNQLDESLSVYWGGEAPAQSVQVGRASSHPAVGDLDGDGRDDLVIARPDLASLVLLRIDPQRQPTLETIFQASQPWGPRLYDHDGDGDLDLFLTLAGDDGCLAVRENRGGRLEPHLCLDDEPLRSEGLARGSRELVHFTTAGGGVAERPLGPGHQRRVRLEVPDDIRRFIDLSVFDIDRDGVDEVYASMIRSEEGPLVRLRSDGMEWSACTLGWLRHHLDDMRVVDLDGDGIEDVVGHATCSGCTSNHVVLRGHR